MTIGYAIRFLNLYGKFKTILKILPICIILRYVEKLII